jgi:hypothetical protein
MLNRVSPFWRRRGAVHTAHVASHSVFAKTIKKADVADYPEGIPPRRLTLKRAPRQTPGCSSTSHPINFESALNQAVSYGVPLTCSLYRSGASKQGAIAVLPRGPQTPASAAPRARRAARLHPSSLDRQTWLGASARHQHKRASLCVAANDLYSDCGHDRAVWTCCSCSRRLSTAHGHISKKSRREG